MLLSTVMISTERKATAAALISKAWRAMDISPPWHLQQFVCDDMASVAPKLAIHPGKQRLGKTPVMSLCSKAYNQL